MRIYCEKDYDAMSRRAANLISAEVIRRPDCVLGLATGSTPVGTYKQLVTWHQRGDFSFKEVRSVNLDEYKGLAPDHDQSYRYFMQSNFFDHIDIRPENTWVPDGLTEDAAAECAQYDEGIRSLGYADLQLLGVGRNGHIGFNEPGEDFMKATHVVDLAESTIDANARFFASRDEVPRQASWPPAGCCCWPAARTRRTPSTTPSAGLSRPAVPAPSSSSTTTWCWWATRPPWAG